MSTMKLQLTRPIAFIDLETTGVTVSTDRIVEIAIVKISPDGTKVVKRKLVNPLMPIPAGSTAVHGISDEMVKDAPSFKQIANEVKQFLENCDLGGYNSNKFDIPLLMEEFLRDRWIIFYHISEGKWVVFARYILFDSWNSLRGIVRKFAPIRDVGVSLEDPSQYLVVEQSHIQYLLLYLVEQNGFHLLKKFNIF